MTVFHSNRVGEGDWVSGSTSLDEKFIGFVEVMGGEGIAQVLVTQSDHEDIVGTSIQAKLTKIKKFTESAPASPEEVKSLIELALETHDKQWFEQLRADLAIVSTVVRNVNGTNTLMKVKGRF